MTIVESIAAQMRAAGNMETVDGCGYVAVTAKEKTMSNPKDKFENDIRPRDILANSNSPGVRFQVNAAEKLSDSTWKGYVDVLGGTPSSTFYPDNVRFTGAGSAWMIVERDGKPFPSAGEPLRDFSSGVTGAQPIVLGYAYVGGEEVRVGDWYDYPGLAADAHQVASIEGGVFHRAEDGVSYRSHCTESGRSRLISRGTVGEPHPKAEPISERLSNPSPHGDAGGEMARLTYEAFDAIVRKVVAEEAPRCKVVTDKAPGKFIAWLDLCGIRQHVELLDCKEEEAARRLAWATATDLVHRLGEREAGKVSK